MTRPAIRSEKNARDREQEEVEQRRPAAATVDACSGKRPSRLEHASGTPLLRRRSASASRRKHHRHERRRARARSPRRRRAPCCSATAPYFPVRGIVVVAEEQQLHRRPSRSCGRRPRPARGGDRAARTRRRRSSATSRPSGVATMIAAACANCFSLGHAGVAEADRRRDALRSTPASPVRKCQPSRGAGAAVARRGRSPSSCAASAGVSRGSKLTVTTSNSLPASKGSGLERLDEPVQHQRAEHRALVVGQHEDDRLRRRSSRRA